MSLAAHGFTEYRTSQRVVWLCTCGWRHSEPRDLEPLERLRRLQQAWREHCASVVAREESA